MLTQTINYSTLEDQLPSKDGYSGLHRGRRNSWDSPVKPKLSVYQIRNRRSSICDTAGTTRLRSSANGGREDNFTVPLSPGLSPVSRYRRMHGTALNRIQGYSARMVSCLLLGTILLMGLAAVFILMQSVPNDVTSGKFRGMTPEPRGTGTIIEAETRSTGVTESTKTSDTPTVGPVTSTTRSRRAQRMIARHDANKVSNNTKSELESDYNQTYGNQNQEYNDLSAPNVPKMEDSINKVGSFDLGTQNSKQQFSASHQLTEPIEAASIPVAAASPDVLVHQSSTENLAAQDDRVSPEFKTLRQSVVPSGQFHVPDPDNYLQQLSESSREQNHLLQQPLAQNVFRHQAQQLSQPVIPPFYNQRTILGSQQGHLVNPSLGPLPNAVEDNIMKQADNWSSAQAQPRIFNQPHISSQAEDHKKVSLPVPSVPAPPSGNAFQSSSDIPLHSHSGQSTTSNPSPDPAGTSFPGQTTQDRADPGTYQESLVAPTETNLSLQEHPQVMNNEQPSNDSADTKIVEQEVQPEEVSYHHPKNLHRLLKLNPKLPDAQADESNADASVVISANDSLPKIAEQRILEEAPSSTGAYSKIVRGPSQLNQTVEQTAEVQTQNGHSAKNVEGALNGSGLVIDSQMSRLHSSEGERVNITLSDSNEEAIENYFRPRNATSAGHLQNFNIASNFIETSQRDLLSYQTLPSAPERPSGEKILVYSSMAKSIELGNGSNKTKQVKDSEFWPAEQNQMSSYEHQNSFSRKFEEMPAPQSFSQNLHIQQSSQQQREKHQYQEQHEQKSIYVSNLQHQTNLPNSYKTDQLMYTLPNLSTKEQSIVFSEAELKPHLNILQASQGSQTSLPSVHQPTLQQTEFRTSNSPGSNEVWQRQQPLQTNPQTPTDSRPQLVPTSSTFLQDQWQNQPQHLLLQEHLLRQANLHQQQPQQQQPQQQQHQQQQPQAPQPPPPWQLHQFSPQNIQVQQQQAWPPKGAPSSNSPMQQQQDWLFKQVDSYQQNDWQPKQGDSYQKQDWSQPQVDLYNTNSPHFPHTLYNYPGSVQPYPGLAETPVSGIGPPPYQNAPAINDPSQYPSQHHPSNKLSPHDPRWPYNSDGIGSHEVPVMEHPVLNPADNFPPGVNPNMYRLY